MARTLRDTALTHHVAAAAHTLPVLACAATQRVTLGRPGLPSVFSRASDPLILRPLSSPTTPLRDWPDVRAVSPVAAVVGMAEQDPVSATVSTNAGLRTGQITWQDLVSAVAGLDDKPRYRSRRHLLLRYADERVESPGESLTLVGLIRAGIEHVEPQASIYDSRGFVARVDFLDADRHVVYEFDGKIKYAEEGALYAEKKREDRLRRLGFQVVRLTWADVTDPHALAALIDRRTHRIASEVTLDLRRSRRLTL